MKYIFIILTITLHFTVSAQVVQNVRFEQSGEEIFIYYDLDKEEGLNNFTVELFYYIHDEYGGQVLSATGDIGENITQGENKEIIWDVLQDIDGIKGPLKFSVVVHQKQIQVSENKFYFGYSGAFEVLDRTFDWESLPYGFQFGILGKNWIGLFFSAKYNFKSILNPDKFLYQNYIIGISAGYKFIYLYGGLGYQKQYYYFEGLAPDYFFENPDKHEYNFPSLAGEAGIIFHLSKVNLNVGIKPEGGLVLGFSYVL